MTTAFPPLNIFGLAPNCFGPDDETVCAMFATHAALALIADDKQGQFESALASRDVIGQAKGRIMERFDVDAGPRLRPTQVALSNLPIHASPRWPPRSSPAAPILAIADRTNWVGVPRDVPCSSDQILLQRIHAAPIW